MLKKNKAWDYRGKKVAVVENDGRKVRGKVLMVVEEGDGNKNDPDYEKEDYYFLIGNDIVLMDDVKEIVELKDKHFF